MQRTPTTTGPEPGDANLHFREQSNDEGEARPDATLSFDGRMNVSSDEDSGSDPYNRTGRFKRLVR